MAFGNPFGVSCENEFGATALGFNGFEVSLNYISGVPDPNTVANSTLKLIFKSLLKRDETTKEKALNELLSYVKCGNTTELKDDLVLITWVQLYPKLSLSENKSVRALAHQVHCQLISTLQKSFLKYLKDSIPILLTGVYDTDSSVAKTVKRCLGEVFQNDQNKINNLWIMMSVQLFNFIDQVLNKETVDSLSDDRIVPRDEAEIKYLRLVNATVSIISHLFQLSVKLEKLDSSLGRFETVFGYENLWHYILVNSSVNNQKIFKSLLGLVNAVLKLKPQLFNDKAWKLISKRIIRALTFVKKLEPSNIMVYAPVVLPIVSTLITLDNSKPEFYAYEKGSKEKVIGFLKAGSLGSDASYYPRLSEYLGTSHLLNVDRDSDVIHSILLADFTTEVARNLNLRAGADFIINALQTNLEIISLSGSVEAFTEILEQAVKITTPLSSRFVDPLAKYVPNQVIEKVLETIGSESDVNLIILLNIAVLKSLSLEKTLRNSLGSLRESAESDEEGQSFLSHPAFAIFHFVISQNFVNYVATVEEFMDELPSLITPLVVEKPIEILISYSKSTLYNKALFIETFDAFIVKLDMISAKDKLLSRLDQFGNKAELLSNSDELKNVVIKTSANYDFSNDSLFKEQLVTNESVIELYSLAKDRDKVDQFMSFYFKYNSENNELLKHLIMDTSLLQDNLWKTGALDSQLHASIEPLLSNEGVIAGYVDSLRAFLCSTGPTPEIISEVTHRLSTRPELYSALVDMKVLFSQFLEAYGDFIDSRLSLGNPLETNIYILNVKEGTFPVSSIKPILNYGIFLGELANVASTDLLVYLGIISEVAIDYSFLANEQIFVDRLLSFKERIDQLLLVSVVGLRFSDVLEKLIANEDSCAFIDILVSEQPNQVLSFYKFRVLLTVLHNLKSQESDFSINNIDILKFDKFVKDCIRSKDTTAVLKLATIASSVSDAFTNEKFERLRNLIASELIGLRPSEILATGVFKLSLLINFLAVNDTDPAYVPLQPQRFNMVLNDINKWLSSDIAMEENFGYLRILLLKLFNTLLGFETLRSNQNLIDVCSTLLQDAIALTGLGEEESLLELQYHTLKLFLTLKKYGVAAPDVIEELGDEFLVQYVEGTDRDSQNQPVAMVIELTNRFISDLPFSDYLKYSEKLVEKYFKSTRLENKRVLLKIIERLILDERDDRVTKSLLVASENELSQLKIADIFVNHVSNPPALNVDLDDLEYHQLLVEYLWNWKLIMVHFNGATLNLRGLYIKQLQSWEGDVELITRFLGFLSTFLELDNKQYLKGLEDNNYFITNYNYDDINDLTKESQNLAVNLYYSILNSLGSLSVNWFNNIKDRGFKAKIEAFTISYISPRLIKEKLDQFQSKVDSFTSRDDELTIKINRVANDIKATKLIDEQYLEVIFKIPDSYPLKNIEVIGPQRIGVKEQQWKAWLLSSQRILMTNGEIEESLEFFMKNVRFHFKGFEDCSICYSILHTDHSLPTKKCTTCENKFHAGCLYKWFKSSGGNTCPLCRSTFNFR